MLQGNCCSVLVRVKWHSTCFIKSVNVLSPRINMFRVLRYVEFGLLCDKAYAYLVCKYCNHSVPSILHKRCTLLQPLGRIALEHQSIDDFFCDANCCCVMLACSNKAESFGKPSTVVSCHFKNICHSSIDFLGPLSNLQASYRVCQ